MLGLLVYGVVIEIAQSFPPDPYSKASGLVCR